MPRFEYKVVPAPKKAAKVKGVKTTEGRFAHELAKIMNAHGADGWEYQRTDTLPCEERHGLTGRTTTFQNMLVFRRQIDTDAASAEAIAAAHLPGRAPRPLAEPAPAAAAPAPLPPAPVEQDPAVARPQAETEQPADADDPVPMPSFQSTTHAAEPAFSSRGSEGRTPRLGAARHPEPSGKAPGVAAQ